MRKGDRVREERERGGHKTGIQSESVRKKDACLNDNEGVHCETRHPPKGAGRIVRNRRNLPIDKAKVSTGAHKCGQRRRRAEKHVIVEIEKEVGERRDAVENLSEGSEDRGESYDFKRHTFHSNQQSIKQKHQNQTHRFDSERIECWQLRGGVVK